MCNAVVHQVTKETITKYTKLANDPVTAPTWCTAMCKELDRLSQDWKGTKGTNTIVFLTHEEIRAIPKDKTITYPRVVVDHRSQKLDPNRVRITAGGNLIIYPDELITRAADLIIAKVKCNSVISTPGARYACLDIDDMYLAMNPMDRPEYMKIPVKMIPKEFMDEYNLWPKVYNGYIYTRIDGGIYGLPQAGILSNKLLRNRLKPHGYYEVKYTPGLWRHVSRPTQFTLVVDEFGVKYNGRENLDHLIQALTETYTIKLDYDRSLYCGITLDWNYPERYVDISVSGYVPQKLIEYNHPAPTKS